MYDKKTLYDYHKYLQDNNTDITFNKWFKKNDLLVSNNNNLFDNNLSKSDMIDEIIKCKNKNKGIKLIYKLLTSYYKNNEQFNDIMI